ncbi:MAG: disulfide bond formation protein B [Minisyncoccia bacterium]
MTFFVTTFTLVSNIFFVLVVLVLSFDQKARGFVYDLVSKYVLELIFLTSFGALVFSLWYSNVVNFPPCELCWIQRIFMYPQVLLSYLAMRKKDLNMVFYLMPMTILGGLVSFYHSLVHWGFGTGLLACTATDGECAKVYVLEYGYITIPFMALSSFIYLLTITLIYKRARQNNGK